MKEDEYLDMNNFTTKLFIFDLYDLEKVERKMGPKYDLVYHDGGDL